VTTIAFIIRERYAKGRERQRSANPGSTDGRVACRHVKTLLRVGGSVCLGAVVVAVGLGFSGSHRVVAATRPASAAGIHKIKHVVIVMQENRSFDSYFGTFPGADGIPMKNGVPAVCVPVPSTQRCVRPFHTTADLNLGGPHDHTDAVHDVDHGLMDGFIRSARRGSFAACAAHFDAPRCSYAQSVPAAVMGYHDGRELPNYWAWAKAFVLQDHLFESDTSWSLPSHLYMVSGWSAKCAAKGDPMSCRSAVQGPGSPPGEPQNRTGASPDYAWTDLTYLLHKHHVSWGYYVFDGTQPDCDDGAMFCKAISMNAKTPGIWNPLPYFDTVKQDGQLGDIKPFRDFLAEAKAGTLPAVSWITPTQRVSDHPPALISNGQTYVTGLIDRIMRSPDWDSTAIFLAWDDWGGFYDHVRPPRVDAQGYGLRVPGLLISPYAKKGYVDHQVLSFDAYLKFIEDDFLGGARIDPTTDGRPDPRPDVRENAAILGSLLSEFDFAQKPRMPMILPLHPRTDITHVSRRSLLRRAGAHAK
jgi:phospholipase C